MRISARRDPVTLSLKVAGYSLLLCMHGAALAVYGQQEKCMRLWRQDFIAEVTSNRILDWTSILRRKGQGSVKTFTEKNFLFVIYCAFYLSDLLDQPTPNRHVSMYRVDSGISPSSVFLLMSLQFYQALCTDLLVTPSS